MTDPAAGELPTRARKDVEKYLLPDERCGGRHPPALGGAHRAHRQVPAGLPHRRLAAAARPREPGHQLRRAARAGRRARSTTACGSPSGGCGTSSSARRRVLLTSGVIARTVTLLPLRRITDLTWKETVLGPAARLRHLPVRVGRPGAGAAEITFLPGADVALPAGQRAAVRQRLGRCRPRGDDEGNAEPPTRTAAQPPAPTGATTPSRSRPAAAAGVRPPPDVRTGAGAAVRQAERRCGSTCTPTLRCPTAPRVPPSCSPPRRRPDSTSSRSPTTTRPPAGRRRGGPAAVGSPSSPAWSCPAGGSPATSRRSASTSWPTCSTPPPRVRRRARPAARRAARARRADRREPRRRRLPGVLGARSSSAPRGASWAARTSRGPWSTPASSTRSTTPSRRCCTTTARTTSPRSTPTSARASRWSARPAGYRCSRTALATKRGRVVGDDAVAAMAEAGLMGMEVDHPDHAPDERAHLRGLAADLGPDRHRVQRLPRHQQDDADRGVHDRPRPVRGDPRRGNRQRALPATDPETSDVVATVGPMDGGAGRPADERAAGDVRHAAAAVLRDAEQARPTFSDCPRRYRFAYVDRPTPPKGPPWAHNTVGAAVHAALRSWWDLPVERRTPARRGSCCTRPGRRTASGTPSSPSAGAPAPPAG